jgi:hypothetical protein
VFDTLRYTKRLEEVGFEKKQAEESIKVLAEIMETNLATKTDILNYRQLTKDDINHLRIEMKDEFVAVRNEMKDEFTVVKGDISDLCHGMKLMETKLTNKLGIMIFSAGGLVIAAIGILINMQN